MPALKIFKQVEVSIKREKKKDDKINTTFSHKHYHSYIPCVPNPCILYPLYIYPGRWVLKLVKSSLLAEWSLTNYCRIFLLLISPHQ